MTKSSQKQFFGTGNWDGTCGLSFGVLNKIVLCTERLGKTVKHTIPPILKILIPSLDDAKIPHLGALKKATARKAISAPDEIVPWSTIESESIGNACSAIGIDYQRLLSQSPAIDAASITNKIILELRSWKNKRGSTWDNFSIILALLPTNYQLVHYDNP